MIAQPQPAPFYVEGRPRQPCETLSDARIMAGWIQASGVHRSLQILQAGKVVDLKRF